MGNELAGGASRGIERFSLAGKVALVTGASRGIGAHITIDGGLTVAVPEDWRALRIDRTWVDSE